MLNKESASRSTLRPESEQEILTALAQGEQEITQGIGCDLDEVLAEADQLLARSSLGLHGAIGGHPAGGVGDVFDGHKLVLIPGRSLI